MSKLEYDKAEAQNRLQRWAKEAWDCEETAANLSYPQVVAATDGQLGKVQILQIKIKAYQQAAKIYRDLLKTFCASGDLPYLLAWSLAPKEEEA